MRSCLERGWGNFCFLAPVSRVGGKGVKGVKDLKNTIELDSAHFFITLIQTGGVGKRKWCAERR